MEKNFDQLQAILNSVNDRNRFLEKENEELKSHISYIEKEISTKSSQISEGAASIRNIVMSNNGRIANMKLEIEFWKNKSKDK